EKEQA
ncbi:Sec-independent protein translocase protein TatA, partial [Haemophilus influenzae]